MKKNETVDRFSGRADPYATFRARLPTDLQNRLEAICGLRSEHVIADIGAGTRMLAERFLEHGHRVTAVEPKRSP